MLLDTLKINHKETFTELLKEKWSNQNLMKELELFETETEHKIVNLTHENELLIEKSALQQT